MTIGFAIASHNAPDQVLRLVTTLSEMYGDPPIACHHDFTRSPCDTRRFPSNVKFVHPHVKTAWGHISFPMAVLKALRLLRESSQPDWVVLLSGSDYPVRRAQEVLAELQSSPCDVFLDHREIRPGFMPPRQTAEYGFSRPEYIGEALVRYYYHMVWLPHPRRESFTGISFGEAMRRIPDPEHWAPYLVLKSDRINKIVGIFRKPVRLFTGDVWFEARVKAVDKLLEPSVEVLARRFKRRLAADEAVFHTAWCNQPDLKICPDSKRYNDWKAGGAHPKWLDESDFARIVASKAHFARKFLPDGEVTDLVDRLLLGRSSEKVGNASAPGRSIAVGP